MFLSQIAAWLQKAESARAARRNDNFRALELIYLRAMQRKRPTPADAFAAVARILRSYLFFPELYFVVVAIAVTVYLARTFVDPGAAPGAMRPLVIVVGTGLGVIIPMALAFVTLPPHLLVGANIWGLTAANVVASALVVGAIEPHVARLFLDDGIATFPELWPPVMIFYALGEFYLLSRANSRLNFQHYKARHRPPGIETLIPAGKQGALISISAQDHYVEIVTTGGRHLERLTMKEAVARAPEGDGIQVHRSHWVALEAIVRLEKSGGGHSVVLTNGARLPVGQPRLADVQAALRARLRESAETRKEPAGKSRV